MEDWLCPSGGAEGPGCGEPISTTGMAGVIANNIPEPASVGLFGIALGLVGIWRRRV
jgi:PEP-CTERM motif